MDSAPTTRSCRFLAPGLALPLVLLTAAIAGAQVPQLPVAALPSVLPGTVVPRVEIDPLFPWITGVPTAPLGATLPGTAVAAPKPPSSIWWSVPIAAAPMAAPLIAGDHVYVAWLPGTVTARHLSDGRELWSIEIMPEQPMAADGDWLFVAAGEAVQAVRTADGSVAWRRPVGAVTAPLLAKDGWVIAATASRITALRAADGVPVWSQEITQVRERAAISGDTLYLPLADGHLEARTLTTGALKWRRRLGGVPAEPLVIGDRLFMGATDKYFYCLDADTGEIEWRQRVGATLRGKASTDGDRVYFAALDNLIRAVDFGDGAIEWQTGVPFRPLLEPLVFGKTVLVAGPVLDLRRLNVKDGKPMSSLDFPQSLAVAPAAVGLSDRILVAAVTGSLDESWQLSVAALPLGPPLPKTAGTTKLPTAPRPR